jgi:hypothetical protein
MPMWRWSRVRWSSSCTQLCTAVGREISRASSLAGLDGVPRGGGGRVGVVLIQDGIGVFHVDVLRARSPGVGVLVLRQLVVVPRLV